MHDRKASTPTQFSEATDPHQRERSNDLGFQQLDRSGDADFDSLQEIVLN
jgi:hypothetical protein